MSALVDDFLFCRRRLNVDERRFVSVARPIKIRHFVAGRSSFLPARARARARRVARARENNTGTRVGTQRRSSVFLSVNCDDLRTRVSNLSNALDRLVLTRITRLSQRPSYCPLSRPQTRHDDAHHSRARARAHATANVSSWLMKNKQAAAAATLVIGGHRARSAIDAQAANAGARFRTAAKTRQ